MSFCRWSGRSRRAAVFVSLLSGLVGGIGTPAQTRLFTTGTPVELAQAGSIGLAHLNARARQRGISDELKITRVTVDGMSMAHVRVQQFHRGIPVFGGEAIAHLKPTGEPSGETDDLVPDVNVDTTPRLTPMAASANARADSNCGACTEPSAAELWVIRQTGVDHLAYRVQLRRTDVSGAPFLPIVFIDAHSGDVVFRYDNLHTTAQ